MVGLNIVRQWNVSSKLMPHTCDPHNPTIYPLKRFFNSAIDNSDSPPNSDNFSGHTPLTPNVKMYL